MLALVDSCREIKFYTLGCCFKKLQTWNMGNTSWDTSSCIINAICIERNVFVLTVLVECIMNLGYLVKLDFFERQNPVHKYHVSILIWGGRYFTCIIDIAGSTMTRWDCFWWPPPLQIKCCLSISKGINGKPNTKFYGLSKRFMLL